MSKKKSKELGQIFTPNEIVCYILDSIGYKGEGILGKAIIDPSCGDGAFLVEVVKRIIDVSPMPSIEENLSVVYGIEIDREVLDRCVERLSNLTNSIGLSIDWENRLICGNALLTNRADYSSGFDFVVGNPPYVGSKFLSKENNELIRSMYAFCGGNSDLYIAFLELSLDMLNTQGICGMITSNSYLRSKSGLPCRTYFSETGNMLSIDDYGTIQLFEDVSNYCCISIFNTKYNETFKYRSHSSWLKYKEVEVPTSSFKSMSILPKKVKAKDRLGDYIDIQVGLQTSCDKAFVVELLKDSGATSIIKTKLMGNVEVESSMLMPVVKCASISDGYVKSDSRIIFPYSIKKDKITLLSEEALTAVYPKSYAYLSSVKDVLSNIDKGNDKKEAWYAYGRKQGLDISILKDKILFCPIAKTHSFVCIEESCLFYSGYAIKYSHDKSELLRLLESNDLQEYIKFNGLDKLGGYKFVNKTILSNFMFDNSMFNLIKLD